MQASLNLVSGTLPLMHAAILARVVYPFIVQASIRPHIFVSHCVRSGFNIRVLAL